jgi:hypothetical protein
VQIAAGKVQWYAPPINVLPTDCQPFPATVFFLLASISSTRRMRRSLPFATFRSYPGDVHISPWRAMSCLSPRRPRGVYLPSLQHLHCPKTTRGFTEPVPAPGPLDPSVAPDRANPGRATNCVRDAERRLARASCGPLVPPHHQLLHF